MSAGVIDVICSQNLPNGTKRLVEILKDTIRRGEFEPFSGVLYSQNGVVQENPKKALSPEKIVTMNWLSDNVIGKIPEKEQLMEGAMAVTSQQGIELE